MASRSLARQIHWTVVAVLVLFAALVSAAWLFLPGEREGARLEAGLAATLGDLLPGPDRPRPELQLSVERLASRLSLDVAVFDREGRLLASAGDPPRWPREHGVRPRGRGFAIALGLPDGRRFVARRPHSPLRAHGFFLAVLGLLALAVAIGAWPVTRRLTRRLERLRQRVEDLGRGDLRARVLVEGRDEVAHVARSFNRAAERIESLVEGQRRILAFASHELRSPLARLRVALEMFPGDAERKAAAARDLAELEALIDELLEASRLAGQGSLRQEEVDLMALLAEESARLGVAAEGPALLARGDERLLRRLFRNLLENAVRHGRGAAVEARIERGADAALVRVSDAGPGVPEAERERIFEPFYRPAGATERGQGYGLGLALVRQIARAHGGEARYLPRPGGGSVFEVTLSLRAGPPPLP